MAGRKILFMLAASNFKHCQSVKAQSGNNGTAHQ